MTVDKIYHDGLEFWRVVVVPPVAEEVIQLEGLERHLILDFGI